jgi:hypothetical protein
MKKALDLYEPSRPTEKTRKNGKNGTDRECVGEKNL